MIPVRPLSSAIIQDIMNIHNKINILSENTLRYLKYQKDFTVVHNFAFS